MGGWDSEQTRFTASIGELAVVAIARKAASWRTAAARQRARSSDGGRHGAVRVRDVVREGVFYKCALNLRLNK